MAISPCPAADVNPGSSVGCSPTSAQPNAAHAPTAPTALPRASTGLPANDAPYTAILYDDPVTGRRRRSRIIAELSRVRFEACTPIRCFPAYRGRRSHQGRYWFSRSQSHVRYFWAVDELDLYMLFLQGGLYAEPDEAAAAINFVDDHCEELNAWMDREPDNASNQPPAKPSFNALPDLVALIDQIGALRRSGWLRFGADMLHLAVETQQRVLDLIDDQITRGSTGPQYRHSAMSLNGMWGHPTVFIAVRPDGVDMEAAKARLQTSMCELAGAQGADRCYGLLFDVNGNIDHFEYLTRSIAEQA